MASVQDTQNSNQLFGPPWDLSAENPPAGTFMGTCLDVVDQFGVELPKYQSPGEIEKTDRTIFLFGFRDAQGKPHKIASKWLRIYFSPKKPSALEQFLTTMLGKAPVRGSDYCAPVAQGGVKGLKVMLSVGLEPKKSGQGTYPRLLSVMAAPTQAHVAAAPAPAPVVAPVAVAPAPAPASAPLDTDEVPF